MSPPAAHPTCCIGSAVSRVHSTLQLCRWEIVCHPGLFVALPRVSPSSCAGVRTCLWKSSGPHSQSSMPGAAAPDLAAESAAARCGSDPVQGFLHQGCARGCGQQQRPPGRCCWAVQRRPSPDPHQPLQRSCLQDAQPAGIQQATSIDVTRGEVLGFVPCSLREC